jgi:hypothetical protein
LNITLLLSLLLASPVYAQDEFSESENPLAQLKEQVDQVLTNAQLQFTPAQESAIILMMEERRRASEDLFGGLQDFRAGPTQGQESDRLRSAIEWMQGEFITRLNDHLTAGQSLAWNDFVDQGGLTALGIEREGRTSVEAEQTQYVRIHNNAYTAEDDLYRFGQRGNGAPGPEVIERGGAGDYHGNIQFLIKDDALNARNPFAQNKPPYQERQLRMDVSGPLIRGRITTGFGFGQNEAENVGTVHATLTDGVFELGIVRPTTTRFYSTNNTLRISDEHSLDLNFIYENSTSENENVGGFTLPERASTSSGNNRNFQARQFSSLSSQSIYETRFTTYTSNSETLPVNTGVQINVLDAFQSGGAQNKSRTRFTGYEFGNMYTRVGENWTLKTGVEGIYSKSRSLSEANFGGAYTFSSLDSFLAEAPINYRRTTGDPLLETSQLEMGFFAQNDITLTPEFTLMLGLRYENQTNISDNNNLDPRIGFAWAVSPNTVIRGGAAIFHQRVPMSVFVEERRLDGTRQFEIVIDNPSFPDPFVAGDVRQTYPSVHIIDSDITTPYDTLAGVQFERTFLSNLFVSASYNVTKYVHRLRRRDANAPLPTCTASLPLGPTSDAIRGCRPDPARGNILNLESTAGEFEQYVRLNYRQRFSIFNVTASYTWEHIRASSRPSNPAIPIDSYNLRADWGLIASPLHYLDTTINAQLPLGIFLTGVVSADSGRRWTITTGLDDNHDTRVNDRPPEGKRGSEDGPNFVSTSFNISKAFFFGNGPGGSRINLNVFANMTNAFNRTNLGAPSGVLTSPNFGRSTSAQDPREIEAGLRFQF